MKYRYKHCCLGTECSRGITWLYTVNSRQDNRKVNLAYWSAQFDRRERPRHLGWVSARRKVSLQIKYHAVQLMPRGICRNIRIILPCFVMHDMGISQNGTLAFYWFYCGFNGGFCVPLKCRSGGTSVLRGEWLQFSMDKFPDPLFFMLNLGNKLHCYHTIKSKFTFYWFSEILLVSELKERASDQIVPVASYHFCGL